MSKVPGKIDVLSEYIRICGIQPDVDRDRATTVSLIKEELASADPTFFEFDEVLLQHELIDSDSMPAKWLAGNRQPIQLKVDFSIKVPVSRHFLANLTRSQGGAVAYFIELVDHGKSSHQAVLTMRDEGFSFNETLQAISQSNYLADVSMFGNEGVANQMLPSIRISRQPRTKLWWQSWMWWVKETNDVSLSEPLLWELSLEMVKALRLPIMPVHIVREPIVGSNATEAGEPSTADDDSSGVKFANDYPQQ